MFFDTAVGGDRWATHFANAQQAEFQYGLAEIAAKHGLNQVWFEAKKNGQVLADGGLGGANPDAPIRVASFTKSITAIAVALLIQEGKLSLDSKLGDQLGPMFAQQEHPLDPSSCADWAEMPKGSPLANSDCLMKADDI